MFQSIGEKRAAVSRAYSAWECDAESSVGFWILCIVTLSLLFFVDILFKEGFERTFLPPGVKLTPRSEIKE